MTLYEGNILQSLLHTNSLAEVSQEQLRELIEQYPYYDAPYFFLAKKSYLQKEVNYENALQNAALHFSNELWFRFNLNNDEPQNGIAEIKEYASEREITSDDITGKEIEVKEEISEKLSNILLEQAAEFDKPVKAATEIPVETTPYHRVDYFDSQGIKLEGEKVNDKLGSQLKRFTEWLKQMKRINANPVNLGNDEAGETEVQHIAEYSNKTGEIITEAMAEVLVKQGKPEQAVQIYEKLSFNNPSKSAYFAAKIEELKN